MSVSLRLYGLAASSILLLLLAGAIFLQGPDDQYASQAFQFLREGRTENIEAGIANFKTALLKDQASPFRWCDLAEAYLASGDLPKARYCFTRGLQSGPSFPAIQLRVANSYLRTGEPRLAMTYMSRLLREAPAYDDIVFSYYDRLGLSLPEILQQGMPVDRRAANAWFQHRLRGGNKADTAGTWSWLCSHALADELHAATYVDGLIKQRQYADAAQAWTAYLAGRPGPAYGNLLLNGSFEEKPTGLALDWNIENSDQAQAVRDCAVSHSGKCSLRIRFDAKENLVYSNVSQSMVVQPGNYRFEAYVRTEEITTEQGVQFRIFDMEKPARLSVATEAVTGTTEWRTLRQTFTVPPSTHVVTIQVFRSRSDKFENRIHGTAWFDQVSVTHV